MFDLLQILEREASQTRKIIDLETKLKSTETGEMLDRIFELEKALTEAEENLIKASEIVDGYGNKLRKLESGLKSLVEFVDDGAASVQIKVALKRLIDGK